MRNAIVKRLSVVPLEVARPITDPYRMSRRASTLNGPQGALVVRPGDQDGAAIDRQSLTESNSQGGDLVGGPIGEGVEGRSPGALTDSDESGSAELFDDRRGVR